MIPPESHTGMGLRQYLDVLRRRKWIVLGVAVVAVAAAAAVSYARGPVYEAETKIVVGQGNSLFEPGEASAVEPFTATMSALVESNLVAARVIDRLDLDRSPEQLLDRIDVSFNPDTAVLDVTVTADEPAEAAEIADTLGAVFSDLVDERFGRPGPGDGGQLPLTATVWDPARANPDPISPRPVRDMAVAGLLGLGLGLLAAFLRDYFDRTLRTREDVEESFGVPVIGQVPFVRRGRGAIAEFWPSFREGAESFRGLRANLQYLAVQRPLRTILVASAAPEQGKTTVAANLAVAIAQSGGRAVVVEGDLRRPRLPDALGFTGTGPGLTSVLVGGAEIEDAVIEIAVPGAEEAATDAGVSVLPSGPLPPNPSELLASAQMEALLDQLAERYDYVVVDSPPLLLVSDALELARLVDGVVFVVRRNRSTSDEAAEARALVERFGIHVLGAVFTDATPPATYYGAYGEPVSSRQPVAARAADASDDERF